MKHTIHDIFRNPNFLVGFILLMTILVMVVLVPFFIPGEPLDIVGGLFDPPGNYISQVGAVEAPSTRMNVDVQAARLGNLVTDAQEAQMLEWLEKSELDLPWRELTAGEDTGQIVELFVTNYSEDIRLPGTSAYRKSFGRLYRSVETTLNSKGYTLVVDDSEADSGYREVDDLTMSDFVNVSRVLGQRRLVLGTDNFGRDVFHEVFSAIGNSLKIGLIAGLIATAIGIIVGLSAGFLGGFVDNILTFFTNLFTVIPSFVLLILISYSLSATSRSIYNIALVIGLTSWPWTARSVRSQTLSLKNRDHVNLSRLSGFNTARIIVQDILPYVLSYVVMAMILQISSAILNEAQLSMLGLGPSTTEQATLGLMLSWSIQFQAPLSGAWWAFVPVVLSIAFISFSMNLMNTGLDQVFNPTLR